MSDLRVFVVLFVRSLDIRANWFSTFACPCKTEIRLETNQKHRKQANHSEKIVLNSSEVNRKKLCCLSRRRVHNFRFMSAEFINFCRQMSGLRVFMFYHLETTLDFTT